MSNKSTRLTFSSIYSPPFPLNHFYSKCVVVGTFDASLHFINPGDKKIISSIRGLASGVSCVSGLKKNAQLVVACTRGYPKKHQQDGSLVMTQSVMFWDYRIPDKLLYQLDIEYSNDQNESEDSCQPNYQQKINFSLVESSQIAKSESGTDLSAFCLLLPQYVRFFLSNLILIAYSYRTAASGSTNSTISLLTLKGKK